jgi:hypothetical protein
VAPADLSHRPSLAPAPAGLPSDIRDIPSPACAVASPRSWSALVTSLVVPGRADAAAKRLPLPYRFLTAAVTQLVLHTLDPAHKHAVPCRLVLPFAGG